MYNILAIGDYIIDRWVECDVHKISQEAPVVVATQIGTTIDYPGGIANAANNINRMIGGFTSTTICASQHHHLNGSHITDHLMHMYGLEYKTTGIKYNTIKTRYVSGGHQIFRLDSDYHMDEHEYREYADMICDDVMVTDAYDGILINDYGKGAIRPELIRRVIEMSECDIVIDPYHTWDLSYYERALGNLDGSRERVILIPNDREITPEIVRYVIDKVYAIVVKCGRNGCKLYTNGDYNIDSSYPSVATVINSVVGAGDVVDASILCDMVYSGDIRRACINAMKVVADALKCKYTVIYGGDRCE